MMISLFDRVENNLGKGEHAGYKHFLAMCSKGIYHRVVKSLDFVVKR